jgi:hypothetical protein
MAEFSESKPASNALQFVLGLGMIAGLLLAAVVVGQQESRKLQAAAVAPAPAADAKPAAEVAAAAPDSSDIKSMLGELTAQVKNLHTMLDGLAKPEPAPDLKPIEAKLDALSQSVASAVPVLDRLDKLGGRMGAVGKQLEGLEAEVVALKTRGPGK